MAHTATAENAASIETEFVDGKGCHLIGLGLSRLGLQQTAAGFALAEGFHGPEVSERRPDRGTVSSPSGPCCSAAVNISCMIWICAPGAINALISAPARSFRSAAERLAAARRAQGRL
jgi:hypothetical protein